MRYAGLDLEESDGVWYFSNQEMESKHGKRAPIIQKREDFVTKHGLSESKSSKQPCWINVLPISIQKTMREKYTNNFTPRGNFAVMGWEQYRHLHDHYELFVKDRQYVYITQPYGVSLEIYQKIENAFGQHDLFVDISYKDAWHSPGATPLIVISQVAVELTK